MQIKAFLQGARAKLGFLKPIVWLVMPKPAPAASFLAYVDQLERLETPAALSRARQQIEVANTLQLAIEPQQAAKIGLTFLRAGDLDEARRWMKRAVSADLDASADPDVKSGGAAAKLIAPILAGHAVKDANDHSGEKFAALFGWTPGTGASPVISASYFVSVAEQRLLTGQFNHALDALEYAGQLDRFAFQFVGQSLSDYCKLSNDPAAVISAIEKRFPGPRFGATEDSPHMDKDTYVTFGKLFLHRKELGPALELFDKAIALDHGAFQDVTRELFAFVTEGNEPKVRYNAITGHYQRLSKLNVLRGRDLPADFHSVIGRHFLHRSDFPSAMMAFRRAIAVDASASDDISSRLHSALTNGQLSDADVSTLAETFAGEGSSLSSDLWIEVARALARRDPNPSESLARVLPAMSHSRLIELGNEALANANHAVAILAYNHAIKRKPQDVLTRLQLGVTHYLANDHAAADAHFAILRSLQRSERERYGVADKEGAVLHSSWIMAIGHVACLDTYVKARELGWIKQQRPVIAIDPRNPPPGMSVLTRFSSHLDIVAVAGDPGPALDEMILGPRKDDLNDYHRDLRRASMMDFFWTMPNREGRMRYYAAIGSEVQQAWQEAGRGHVLSISDEENAQFRMTMEQAFGLPRDAWFVVLHVRESGFKTDWEAHHKYTRNAQIEDYNQCIDHIVKAGGWVVRAGDPSMRSLKPMDHVIDYATSPYRSPELDVLLCAKAKFFLGTNSGFSLVPPLFGTRCVLTNWSPLANPNWYPQDIFVPKLILNRATGTPLTIEEAYTSLAGWSQFERDFTDEWAVVDNTPEQLLDAVIEMMNELDKGARLSPADQRLQDEYASIVRANGGYVGSRMSAKFLRDHQQILGRRTPPLAQSSPARVD
jgi:putative glycosyltransferase (TIGR04372 family)